MDITKQAIAEHVSRRYFEPSTALARVLDEAPYLPRCSDDKTAARVRPRDIAVRYPYMQINRPGFVSWLIFDLDHNNPMIWQDAGLPAPNLIVSNRDTGGAHLFYAIPPVCTSENARSKPIAYMKAVYEAFAARLNADMDFHSGPVAKTPGHPWWRTWELHPEVYELGKLADYVDLAVSSPWGRGPRLDDVSHSRHCIMFEQLRYYAYSIENREREKGSFEVFSRLLEAYAYNKNNFATQGFSSDLAISSIRATVKSVARWTWDKYHGGGSCHRGVMKLNPRLPLQERQRLAAERTHDVRHKATESKVRAAARLIQQKGQEVTLVGIARIAGLARQTVAAYKHVLAEAEAILQSTVVIPLARAAGYRVDVNYAVHQVSASGSHVAGMHNNSSGLDGSPVIPDVFDG